MESVANKAVGELQSTIPATAVSPQVLATRKLHLMLGAWLGIVGALLAFVANGLHPHPNDFRLEALLQAIANSPSWSTIHLILLFALLLILGALVAITFTIDEEPGATVARYACLAVLFGGTLIFVSTALDGFAMNQLARSWLDASPAERAIAFRVADALEIAQYAVYSLSDVIFLGIGIFLYGLAIVVSRAYPRTLGWLAMISGIGTFAVGIVELFYGPSFRGTEIFSTLFAVMSTIWLLLMGVVMWRMAHVKHVRL